MPRPGRMAARMMTEPPESLVAIYEKVKVHAGLKDSKSEWTQLAQITGDVIKERELTDLLPRWISNSEGLA